jgi:UDP-2-acetamido-2,6-beta-L-arabino-hexul-4-ose reductase
VHLAGENRPLDPQDFSRVNVELTRELVDALRQQPRRIPLLLASSTQASLDTPYGRSKLAAEREVEAFARESASPAVVYRLPGIFGKWARPNYNSVVATFCHNVANQMPIVIDDPAAPLTLNYVDDVVEAFLRTLRSTWAGCIQGAISPNYQTTVGELAAQIHGFRDARRELRVHRVGVGLTRALYATYMSYLPTDAFSYAVKEYADTRGVFVELLKTNDSGQVSFFTSKPGITRGGHYHHTKSEKFLVIKGEAVFRFRNIVTDERHELRASGASPRVVETIPGWAHDVTNAGNDEMIALLWANEVFDRERPDTFGAEV